MIQAWQRFLEQQGAQFDQNRVGGFEGSNNQLDNTLSPLNSWRLFQFSGADAVSFMQGQFSNDVNLLNGSNSQISSYNSPKGRMYSCFRLFKQGDNYFLRLPADVAETVIKRLRMFVLRSEVMIEDVSDNYVHLGLIGEASKDALQQAGIEAPAEQNSFAEHQGVLIMHSPGATSRFELFVPMEQAESLWSKLIQQLQPSGENSWELAEIRAGQPEIYQPTMESFVAQMTNLDLVDGISFKKGCYVGQEIVARTHYLGKQKKRMFLLSANSDVKVADKLFEHGSENSQSIGEVVRVAKNEQGESEFLAVMQIKNSQSDIRLENQDGVSCKLGELPYPFPAEE